MLIFHTESVRGKNYFWQFATYITRAPPFARIALFLLDAGSHCLVRGKQSQEPDAQDPKSAHHDDFPEPMMGGGKTQTGVPVSPLRQHIFNESYGTELCCVSESS